MPHCPRFAVSLVVLALWLSGSVLPAFAGAATELPLPKQLAALEQGAHGRLGVVALDTGTGKAVQYRGTERFPFCSTFKLLLAAAVLQKSATVPGLLEKHIAYTESDLLSYAPITRTNLPQGMTIGELCAAALQYSDNTAANLLLGELGGVNAVTAFARSLGDRSFRLDRMEPELNTAIPGDPRDTTTPRAMADDLRKLVLGNALPPAQREQLITWIVGNTTGKASIQAGVPPDWTVGDKTGSGSYGTTNDVAVLWPPQGKPIVLALYFTQTDKDAPSRKDVLASATRLVLPALRK